MYKPKSSIEIIKTIDDSTGILNKIRKESHVEKSEFDQNYLNPIVYLADWIQMLPLSTDHHSEMGGALRFSMNCAFAALRISDSYSFTPPTQKEVRIKIEPEYKYAAYLGSLFSAFTHIFQNLTITVDNHEWDKQKPLIEFPQYNVNWNKLSNKHAKSTSYFLSRIFPMHFIMHLDSGVQQNLVEYISSQGQENSINSRTNLSECISRSINAVIEMELDRVKKVVDNTVVSDLGGDLDVSLDVKNDNKTDKNDNKTDKNDNLNGGDDESSEDIKRTDANNSQELTETSQSTINHPSNPGIALPENLKVIISLLNQDLISGKKDVSKLKHDDTGLIIPSTMFNGYGLSLNTIEKILRSKRFVVNKKGQQYTLTKDISSVILNGVESPIQDLFES